MRIINVSKDAVIAESFEECKTFWEQTRGMMFRKEVVPLAFTFPRPQKVKLHSWFCPGPMDLIFLDDTWEVVEVYSEWEQRSGFTSAREASILLELPAGAVWKSRTQVGDTVHIVRDFPFIRKGEPPKVQKSPEAQAAPRRVLGGTQIR